MSATTEQVGTTSVSTSRTLRSRRLMVVGALLVVSGLAISATSAIAGTPASEHGELQQAIGGVIMLAGWAALTWSIHRFGRASAQ